MFYFYQNLILKNIKALEKGKERGLNIENPGTNYENGLEKEGYIAGIIERFRDESLIIIEVGGIIAEKIVKTGKNMDFVKGIVEVTTFGHNRHIKAGTNKKIPVYSVARSPIKEEESRHVGYAVYNSLYRVLNYLDRAVNDCNITMVGYGMIGQNVCNAMKGCKNVNVFDIDKEKVNEAQKNGFSGNTNYNEVIQNSDIIIASTGHRSIDEEFIKSCPDGVLLVSAGSRQNEIDVGFLEENTQEEVRQIHEFIKRYVINEKEVFLFRDGKNANFASKSCPANSMDLLHAEILTCVKKILVGDYNILDEQLNEISDAERQKLMEKHKNLWS